MQLPARHGLEGDLLETWKTDPEESLLMSAMTTVVATYNMVSFQDGEYVVKHGDKFVANFKIEEGTAEVSCCVDTSEDTDEEDEEVMLLSKLAGIVSLYKQHFHLFMQS